MVDDLSIGTEIPLKKIKVFGVIEQPSYIE
jgi:hypothetical protein